MVGSLINSTQDAHSATLEGVEEAKRIMEEVKQSANLSHKGGKISVSPDIIQIEEEEEIEEEDYEDLRSP